ncbi:LysE family translocator [Haloferula sp.]|uniref:LysE family translocator n=1 Tax=Haloferula sp. TaxID=2497595 RepID=UPI003C70FCD0
MNAPLELMAFAGVLALGQFSPGPDMLLLTRTALKEGARSGVLMASGIATGLTFHAALAITGMAVVFERSAWLREGMHWLAAVYLAWLAYQMLREWFVHVYSGARYEEVKPSSKKGAFVQGLLCNLFNPKVVVFLAAVVTPFLAGERPGWWPWALWAIVVIEGLTLWALWALVLQAGPVKEAYRRAGPWIMLAFGVAMIGLAVKIVVGVL